MVPARGSTGFAADSSIAMISSEGEDSGAVSSTVIGDSEADSVDEAVGTAAVLGAGVTGSTAAEGALVDAADSTAGGADSMVDEVALMEAVDFMVAAASTAVEAVDFMVEAASTAVEGAASMVAGATVEAASMAVEVMAAGTDN